MFMNDSVLSRNNVKVFGDGSQPLLFAHGFGCDQHMWRYVSPAFEKDYRIILFDYVGGFERSDIEGLLETMDKNYIGWANFLAPAIMKNPDRPELAAELTESFCSTDPVIASQFARATFFSDNRRDLAQVSTPSLILQCSDDIIAPLSVGDYLSREMPGSTLRVMQATGHCPHMSEPDETVSLIKEYLANPVA